jgi:PEP-CTERM motif
MPMSRGFGAIAALFLAAAPFQAAPACADVIFDFSGTCDLQGCSGIATGVLTLADSYVFGADIKAAEFISFDYSSSDVNLEVTSADAPSLIGGLNANGSIHSRDELVVEAAPIIEAFVGVFEAAPADREHVDEGAMFTFTLVSGAVPEPSTWAMLLLGFAGLGSAGYRRARQTAVARV